MKTSEVLSAALQLLDGGNRWIKGRRQTDAGYCSVGAVYAVASARLDAAGQLRGVTNEQFPDRGEGIVSVNDHPDTTWPDIERCFEKAILKAQEEEL